MHIVRIELTNFWGFSAWSCDLEPGFNLLIGPNGSGKSAAVDGLRVALEAIPRGLGYGVIGLGHDDVRRSEAVNLSIPASEFVVFSLGPKTA